MIRAAMAVLTLSASAATAQIWQGPAPSASWYADNPREREQEVARCYEHPGPARTSDHCAAAWQGNILAAMREFQRHLGEQPPPPSTVDMPPPVPNRRIPRRT